MAQDNGTSKRTLFLMALDFEPSEVEKVSELVSSLTYVAFLAILKSSPFSFWASVSSQPALASIWKLF